MKRTIEFLLLLISLMTANKEYAQSPTQVIRGTVIDKQSLITLPGANVVILGSDPPKGASSGPDGSFKISGVTPGRYDLQATYLGYKSVIIPSIVVSAGKEVILEIGLEESVSSLKEVVVSGVKKQGTINQMAPVSALNPNALNNSDFFTSAFPADYGNATAGVFDINLRNGNTEKREHMIQFGALTGLEAMSEGPFKTETPLCLLPTWKPNTA